MSAIVAKYPIEIPAEVTQLAVALWASLNQGDDGISQADALRAALHAERTGEVFGRDSYIGQAGKVKGQVLEGYRAIQNRITTRYQLEYRPLTQAEREFHGDEIGPHDWPVICECYVYENWQRAIEMGVPYSPFEGLGIVRASERAWPDGKRRDAPAGKTWKWVLRKRAKKDALRQLPANLQDPADWQDGDDEEDNAQTRRLAAADQAAQNQAAQLRALPAPQLQARAAANVTAMRGPTGFQGFGDEPEPQPANGNGQPPPPPADAEFASLPVAPASATAANADASPRPASASATTTRKETVAFNTAAVAGPIATAFWTWAKSFAQEFPRYAREDGAPDNAHILQAVFACGHKVVAAENLEQVKAELRDRAQAHGAAAQPA